MSSTRWKGDVISEKCPKCGRHDPECAGTPCYYKPFVPAPVVETKSMRPFFTSNMLPLVVALLIGGFIGYNLKSSPVQYVETPAPSIELSNGALVAQRLDINVPPPAPIQIAAKELKGKVVRAGVVEVKPTQEECEPVSIDWGVVKLNDGNRMVFKTNDGQIIAATDIPIETTTIMKHPKWTLGVMAPVDNLQGAGPLVQRHFGKLSIGAGAMKMKTDGWTGSIIVAVSW